MVKQGKDIRYLLSQRLHLWESNEYDTLINEAISCDKGLVNRSNLNIDGSHVVKVFNRLMMKGKVRDAMNWFEENGKNIVLHPNAIVGTNNKTVVDVLNEKHPEAVQLEKEMFSLPNNMNKLPYLQQVTITNKIVEKISRRLQGGGGPGGSNSDQWKDFLLRYGKASHRLRDAVATLTNVLCNQNIEWKQIHALMSCRLIALDKCPGIRPIGIGECLRRILSKCVLEVTKKEVTEACQTDQLCSGLQSGIEGAVHAMNILFESRCNPNSNWGLLLVDAKNAFNMANRQMALWQARCYWPKTAKYLFNTYCGNSELIVRESENILYSKEGVIQGDPLSMPLYALTTLPLIKSLSSQRDIKQCWYADDSSAQGSFEDLLKWWILFKLWIFI